MATKNYYFWIPVCCVLAQLSLFASCDKPKILSEYEIILDVGDNFSVLCQGNTRLKWSWPTPKLEEYSEWTQIIVHDVIPSDNSYSHASRLLLKNATYQFVGFYRCFGEGVDPLDDDRVDKIYLYVRDEENLFIKSSNDDVDSITVTQYSDAVIPCKPTSPDVKVELTRITGENVLLDVIDEDGTSYHYHPHFGFITNDTRQVKVKEVYQCVFTRHTSSSEMSIIVKVEKKLAKPTLEDASDGHTVLGDDLVLECRVTSSIPVHFKWITPSGKLDPPQMPTSNQTASMDPEMYSQKLTVKKSQASDSGFYRCEVSDNQNHSNYAELNVTIF